MVLDLLQPAPRLHAELATFPRPWLGYENELQRMGFSRLAELRGRDPTTLARDYCVLLGRPEDPLLGVCFAAIVRFAETGEVIPWWQIMRTEARDQRQAISAAV